MMTPGKTPGLQATIFDGSRVESSTFCCGKTALQGGRGRGSIQKLVFH